MTQTDLKAAHPVGRLTPALEQYLEAKGQHPDAMVMFRMGDFLEMFFEDAERASRILGITLTSREMGKGQRCPLAGVPFHSHEAYVARLLEAGIKVAICDQVEEASQARGVVRREVTRVLSPGTLVESTLLLDKRPNRLVAISRTDSTVGVASYDVSTSRMMLAEWQPGELGDRLAALNPAELLLGEGAENPLPGTPVSVLPAGAFDAFAGERDLVRALGLATLAGYELVSGSAALAAAGAALYYTRRNRVEPVAGGVTLTVERSSERMLLDAATLRNLELFLDSQGHRQGSLLDLIDRTVTAMGGRMLAEWLAAPLVTLEPLLERQVGVARLAGDRALREQLRRAIEPVRDLERLTTRAGQGWAAPRELQALGLSLQALSRLDLTADQALIDRQLERARYRGSLSGALLQALVDQPPATAREGGCIRPGYDPQLDEIHRRSADARAYISGLEEQERARTGMRNLKLGFNRVFGYYLEVTNAQRGSVPADYIRRQTLANCERYVTAELKEQEAHVLSADAAALRRESELLAELSQAVREEAGRILEVANAVAVLDALASLGELGAQPGWCLPVLEEGPGLELTACRHPLVAAAIGSGFVPNDLALDAQQRRIMLLTGPNMAGKSTFLRQAGIAVVLAQAGGFIPAEGARTGLFDRVFTRVGAQDDITRGLSTFMVEMVECAAILHSATSRSLVLIDELGRGTSTYDGVSIAQAVIEHLHDAPGRQPLAIVATHYHELTALSDELPSVANFRMDVSESGDDVIFLHRVVEGGADRSYGIHVARLAGLPAQVVARARQVLAQLERERPLSSAADLSDQIPLPLGAPHPLVERLGQLDLDNLTPRQALVELFELREEVLSQ
ncbi:MAG: DNA mismatch repair protein MutS [Candidatus Dormibacteria bacterium]